MAWVSCAALRASTQSSRRPRAERGSPVLWGLRLLIDLIQLQIIEVLLVCLTNIPDAVVTLISNN